MSDIARVRCDRAKYALRYLGAVVVGVSLTFGWAGAASEGDKAKSERAESKAERAESKAERVEATPAAKDEPKKSGARKPTSDTDACRRDAQGMHGPERARFMTDCLKRN